MNRPLRFSQTCIILLALFLLSPSLLAQGKGGGKPGGGTKDWVTVSVRDAFGDRVRSDNQGSYQAWILGETFQMYFDSSGQAERRMELDFTDCELDCTAPFANTVILGASIQANNKDLDINAIPAGSTLSDRFKIRFTDPGGSRWVIRYFGDTETCGTTLPSGLVTITRAVGADQWTVTAPDGAVGCLLKIEKSKGREVFTPHGRFRMPFSLTISRP